jgi:hypothetical protein
VSRGWLIDTNIVSEWVKRRPDARLVSWLEEVDDDPVFLSVVSLAEIRFGVELLLSGVAALDWTSGFESNCRNASRGASCRWMGRSLMPAAACCRERARPAAGEENPPG